jgi:secreted trypsin-like serine protease
MSNTVRQTHDVDRIVMHPSYNPSTLQNDIALTRTVLTLQFTENIQPICGPEPTNQYAHQLCHSSGWGTLFSGGPCCPQTLQYVTMNVTTNAYCDVAYPTYRIYDDMVCASDNTGHRDRDTCQGDSGGPLAVQGSDGSFTIIGIVSWGIGCASGYPGVYARVSYFHDWVLMVINTP